MTSANVLKVKNSFLVGISDREEGEGGGEEENKKKKKKHQQQQEMPL